MKRNGVTKNISDLFKSINCKGFVRVFYKVLWWIEDIFVFGFRKRGVWGDLGLC